MCGRISTLNSSPGFNVYLGFLAKPTPAGVPVIMTVPGGRVVPCDKNDTIFGMLKIKSSVPQLCNTEPSLPRPRTFSFDGSGMAVVDTNVGPVRNQYI